MKTKKQVCNHTDPNKCPICSKRKTVPFAKLTTISMVNGGEKTHPVIIHDGIVKQWVGFGWVDERKATKEDETKYPTAV